MQGSVFATLLVIASCLAGLLFLPVIVGFLAGIWEKQLVWPYVADGARVEPRPESSNPYQAPGTAERLPANEYGIAMGRQAELRGFRPLGPFFHARGKLYRQRYEFWLSSDETILGIVACGTLASIPLDCTYLFSRLSDGHCLETLDEAKGADADVTGGTRQVVLANADFAEILDHHRRRVGAASSPAIAYSPSDPLADHRAYLVGRAERQVSRGSGKYLDAERHWIRFTVKGAFLTAYRMTMRNWIRMVREWKREQIARPGQRRYVPSDQRPIDRPRWMGRLKLLCVALIGTGLVLAFTSTRFVSPVEVIFGVFGPLAGWIGLFVLWVLKFALRPRHRPSAGDEPSPGVR